MFDLEADPYELTDLATGRKYELRRQTLRDGVLGWWKQTGGGKLRLP